jgi:4-hydroxy-2-oxoheptanedioate aldolase
MNKTLAKLRSGQNVIGAGTTPDSPDVVEILAAVGFDYVTLDLEHVPYDELLITHCIRAANAFGITPIVRAPYDPDLLLRLLTAGAQGLHIPQISTASEAREVVSAIRLHPKGKRTFYSTGRSGNYGIGMDDAEFVRVANEETLVILQVEDEGGIANLDGILAVPDYDAIQFGPKDLRQSMGFPDPEVVWRVIERSIARAAAVGRWVSMIAWTGPDALADKHAAYGQLGVRMVTGQVGEFLIQGAHSFLARAHAVDQLP